MSDIIAPRRPGARPEKGIDYRKTCQAIWAGQPSPEDLDGGKPAAAPAGDTSYWDVDHSQYGPVTEEPMSRFAQVARANLGAANALIPQVTHHDRADVTAIEALRAT